MTNPAKRLHDVGQSLWLDSINRVMVSSGALARYVDKLAVTGLTFNPTILGHAMAASHDYDASLHHRIGEEIADPQDLVYGGRLRGPRRRHSTLPAGVGGDERHRRLRVGGGPPRSCPRRTGDCRAGAAPARPGGLRQPTRQDPRYPSRDHGAGGDSGRRYRGERDAAVLDAQAAKAYPRALKRRLRVGQHVRVPSVASVFVSRGDRAADPLLPGHLHATLGLAMAHKVYASYCSMLSSEHRQMLVAAGACPQRVLWASTSAKDPGLTDSYYVARLAAPEINDTMPEKTLLAFADHGTFDELLEDDYAAAERLAAAIAAAGADNDALAESLQRQGAKAFGANSPTAEAIGAKAAGK